MRQGGADNIRLRTAVENACNANSEGGAQKGAFSIASVLRIRR